MQADLFSTWASWLAILSTWPRLFILMGEFLLLLFLLPWIVLQSGLFPPLIARMIAVLAASILYIFLPDPIDIAVFVDDLLFLGLLLLFVYPQIKGHIRQKTLKEIQNQ